MKTKNIWITSDTHYSHKNITGPEVSNWTSGYRNFLSINEMNAALVNGINKYVKENDVLYHLGDWSFGGAHNIKTFRDFIVCKNIHLIRGNHDQHIYDKLIEYQNEIFNPLSLFSSVQDVCNVIIHNKKFFFSHYAHRVWNGSHKNVLHCYGHSHGTIPNYEKSMDVGIDVAFKMFGEYRPFNIKEVIKILN
jgi:calcineurin-like phosphoesterase family protein